MPKLRMSKTEQQRLALAMLKIRPPVVQGTRACVDRNAQKVWFDTVSAVAEAIYGDNPAPVWFFDAAGVPD